MYRYHSVNAFGFFCDLFLKKDKNVNQQNLYPILELNKSYLKTWWPVKPLSKPSVSSVLDDIDASIYEGVDESN